MHTKEKLISDIVQIIGTSLNMPLPEGPITDATLLGAGGMELDSIKVIELVVRLEANYGISVPDEELKQIYDYTIGQLTDLIGDREGAQ
ncbi:acyl carrier protein [Paenibacillus kobensis]|uniref:acyl carrier protein n=1 Tax=Paenibacillus kobensis TaxID=59841 RepID=UPI000FD6E3F0|nr:phosphopantetheine-binding protein [Paenibacillus kobensis]